MAKITRKYNPGFLTDDELVASFCVRTAEFEVTIETLYHCTGSSNPHQIIIGPRGSGKTYLLLRIAAEVRRDARLAAEFFPVVFAEESYEVATAGEFWLECLSRLSIQVPYREDAPDLHRTFKELRTIQDDRELAGRCVGALLGFANRESKRLVLIVENLDMMFRDMADTDAGWRLRKILQTEPRIILLASATSRFDEIDNSQRALYEQFSVLTLRPLDTHECVALWETVAGRSPSPESIRALQILTGGSPRLLGIVARFGAELSFRNLMASLLDLVDDHTEYFKTHLESLPAQERRIYLALATLWKPATAKEIAIQARTDTSKCSAQLARLIERGAVQSVGGSAWRKQYYLTERLYNIYYLLRRSRRSDRLVESLIQFMEAYYSRSELGHIGASIIHEARNCDAVMLEFSPSALTQLVGRCNEWFAAGPEGIMEVSDRRRTFADTAGRATPRTNVDSRRVKNALKNEDVFKEMVAARDMIVRVIDLVERHRGKEALHACDDGVRRLGQSNLPIVQELVAKALVCKGIVLRRMDRREDALSVWNEVVDRFGASGSPEVVVAVVSALANWGLDLFGLGRRREALKIYDEIAERIGRNRDSTLDEVAKLVFPVKCRLEFRCKLYEQSIETGRLTLDLLGSERPGKRAEVHLIRAEAILLSGNRTGYEHDVETALKLLPDAESLPEGSIRAFMFFSVELGLEHMCERIKASPSSDLLLPLTTALEMELGREPRVAHEVKEVAGDIRLGIGKLRETITAR